MPIPQLASLTFHADDDPSPDGAILGPNDPAYNR